MKAKKELSIIIPVYNEAENIQKTIEEIHKFITISHEILVVYDLDSDTTLPLLKTLQKKYRNLFAYKNIVSRGPSGAIRTGIHHSRGNNILVTMADLCDDLSQVDSLLVLVRKGAKIVCPSRYCKGGEQQLHSPFKVGFPKTAGYLLKLLTGIPTSDPTNSYKLYSGKLLRSLSLKSTVSFSVTLEIVAKAHCLGLKIVEIPTVWKDRQHGKTNFKLWRSISAYTPWFLFALMRNRIFHLPEPFVKKLTYTN